MFLCMISVPIGAMSLGQVMTNMADVIKARHAANKLFALKDRIPKIKKPELGVKEVPKDTKITGKIVFDKVSFSYPTDKTTVVLDNVSFTVDAGKTVAIVGPSGSGKSTVINLLERYYDPSGGEGLMDGEKIHNFDIDHLRRNIGYVSQLQLLFA